MVVRSPLPSMTGGSLGCLKALLEEDLSLQAGINEETRSLLESSELAGKGEK
jgi:hypothetical protein